VRLKEYDVAWEPWRHKLNKRWLDQLQKLETASSYYFVTPEDAHVVFTCSSDGKISNVYLNGSCGVGPYDQLQIQALINSMPVPPFPKGTQRTTITLSEGWGSHPNEKNFNDVSRKLGKERVRKWD